MAKRKRTTPKRFDSANAMDEFLESQDLGEVFAKSGRVVQPKIRRVNLDLPQWLLDQLDLEAARAGVARQPLIKLWLIQKLDEERKKRVA